MGICKLGDFGFSLRMDDQQDNLPCQTKDLVGTAAYAAPEVLRGCRPSPASDVYSFGILLWQVQTREVPFAGEHPHVIIYKVSFMFTFNLFWMNFARICFSVHGDSLNHHSVTWVKEGAREKSPIAHDRKLRKR